MYINLDDYRRETERERERERETDRQTDRERERERERENRMYISTRYGRQQYINGKPVSCER